MNLTIARELLMFGYRIVGENRRVRRIDRDVALRKLRQSPVLADKSDLELDALIAHLYPIHKNHRKGVRRYKIDILAAETLIKKRGVRLGGIERYVLHARAK